MIDLTPLPDDLRAFIGSVRWTFAKTYAATWPHEYIVRARVDEELFVRLVVHIRTHGYQGSFYRRAITYFDEAGMVYWTMGEALDQTSVANRCKKGDTYEARLRRGALPPPRTSTPNSCIGLPQSNQPPN